RAHETTSVNSAPPPPDRDGSIAGNLHGWPSHALAASISPASKYLILAIVNGLHTLAIHFSQVFSPTRAILAILVQWVVENLMSSHSALASQPWKSWNCASTFTFPSLAISASTSGTNFL